MVDYDAFAAAPEFAAYLATARGVRSGHALHRGAGRVLDQRLQRVHHPAHQRAPRARVDPQHQQDVRDREGVRAVEGEARRRRRAGLRPRRDRAGHPPEAVPGAAHPLRARLRGDGMPAAAQRGLRREPARRAARRPGARLPPAVAGEESRRRGDRAPSTSARSSSSSATTSRTSAVARRRWGATSRATFPPGAERDLLTSGRFRVVKTAYDWTLNSQANARRGARRSQHAAPPASRAFATSCAARSAPRRARCSPELGVARARDARAAADVRSPGKRLRRHHRRDAALRLRLPRLLPERRGEPHPGGVGRGDQGADAAVCVPCSATRATCSSPTAR